ncbi:phosphoglycolate phosphatase [Catenulispora sp. GAS73]|uniref:HAD family hydrolase n=1 Tax=Catenulispora sp. GAS73 TaxID=3156269 RepID=UPI003511C25B
MTAVLFDLDGTLADTPGAIARILADMCPLAPSDQLAASVGRPIAGLFAELLAADEDSPAVRVAVSEFRARFADEVVPQAADLVFPAIRGLLDELVAAGRPIAVVTSKSPAGASEFLEAAGLAPYFPVTVGFVAGVPGKPAPDQALAAAKALGVEPADCVVVGDSTDDMLMAVAAGMRGVGVAYGVASVPDLRAAGAAQVAQTSDGLAPLLLPEEHRPLTTVSPHTEVSP